MHNLCVGGIPLLIEGQAVVVTVCQLFFVMYTLYVGCMVVCIIIYQFDSTEQYTECHSQDLFT